MKFYLPMYQKQKTLCPEIIIYETVKLKKKCSEQKNTDLGILSESIEISYSFEE